VHLVPMHRPQLMKSEFCAPEAVLHCGAIGRQAKLTPIGEALLAPMPHTSIIIYTLYLL
jgi:hypothetical protein